MGEAHSKRRLRAEENAPPAAGCSLTSTSSRIRFPQPQSSFPRSEAIDLFSHLPSYPARARHGAAPPLSPASTWPHALRTPPEPLSEE